MTDCEEIKTLLERLAAALHANESQKVRGPKQKLEASAALAGKAASRSWLGYHARVYFDGLRPPPPGHYFDSEWGFTNALIGRTAPGWKEYSDEVIQEWIMEQAGSPNLAEAEKVAEATQKVFDTVKEESLAILRASLAARPDSFIETVVKDVATVKVWTLEEYQKFVGPSGQIATQDSLAATQGVQVPPHVKVAARIFELDAPSTACEALAKALRPGMLHLQRIGKGKAAAMVGKSRVFIGHGKSAVWRDLKDFIQDRLSLPWDEFNREPVAGKTTVQRLSEMMDNAAVAFLVMTAEDEQADGKVIARQNVIHEVGLFQGRLGFSKAVVLLEEGCDEFSNIQGLGQIRFSKGKIRDAFEDIRGVLEREGVIPTVKADAAPPKKRFRPI